jgi:hypothetical protein
MQLLFVCCCCCTVAPIYDSVRFGSFGLVRRSSGREDGPSHRARNFLVFLLTVSREVWSGENELARNVNQLAWHKLSPALLGCSCTFVLAATQDGSRGEHVGVAPGESVGVRLEQVANRGECLGWPVQREFMRELNNIFSSCQNFNSLQMHCMQKCVSDVVVLSWCSRVLGRP